MQENFINKTRQPFTVLENKILQKKTIFKNANQKMCYFYLYSLRNYAITFPSHDTIAEAVCCSVSTVKRILVGLEDLGLLEIKKRPGYTSIYTLNDYYEVAQIELCQNELGDSSNRAEQVAHNELRGSSKQATKTKEFKKKELKKNDIKTTSSSLDKNSEGLIDKKLKEKYPSLPFDEIKNTMMSNESLIIKTKKQYEALLLYRLENFQLKRNNGRVAPVPYWMNERGKKDTPKEKVVDPDMEKRRRKLIESLNNNMKKF